MVLHFWRYLDVLRTWSAYRTRSNSIDVDVVRTKFQSEGFGQHDYATFRCIVVDKISGRMQGINRGEIDDFATMTSLNHLSGRGLSAEEGALQVNVHDLVPQCFGDLQGRREGINAGIVNQNIQPAQSLHSRLNHFGDTGNIASVSINPSSFTTSAADLLNSLLRSILVDVRNHDACARLGKPQCNRLTNAHRSTRYDSNLACQVK